MHINANITKEKIDVQIAVENKYANMENGNHIAFYVMEVNYAFIKKEGHGVKNVKALNIVHMVNVNIYVLNAMADNYANIK
jgi:hypothetical protein